MLLHSLSGFLMVHMSKPLRGYFWSGEEPKTLEEDIIVHLGLALTAITITSVISSPKLLDIPSFEPENS